MFCICVPGPLTKAKAPDVSYVIGESEIVSKHLQPRQSAVVESTTYPGTIRDFTVPIMERSGLKAAKGFYLAFSPAAKLLPNILNGLKEATYLFAQLLLTVRLLQCEKGASTQ
jgi:UDP-N-acetyl-D-mannosaminuronate dehydrogenase